MKHEDMISRRMGTRLSPGGEHGNMQTRDHGHEHGNDVAEGFYMAAFS